jgi:site-specific DNA recombinase
LKNKGASTGIVWDRIERAVVGTKIIRITLSSTGSDGTAVEPINIPWTSEKPNRPDTSTLRLGREPDQKLLQSLVRGHAWLSDLANDRFSSIEEAASKANMHSKVMRQALKLAFPGS